MTLRQFKPFSRKQVDNLETIPAVIHNSCLENADRFAIVEGDEKVTYKELGSRVTECAKAFIAAGITKGDRVGLWAPNSAEWIVIALGIQSVGASLVPINTRYKPGEASYPLQKTEAKILFTADGFMGIEGVEAARKAEGESGIRIRTIDINEDDEQDHSFSAFLSNGQNIDDDLVAQALNEVSAVTLCDIMFTSGSTGKPKGVRHQHGPTVRQTFNTIEENQLTSDDRMLVINPFFHVFGYTGGWVPALFSGATVYPFPIFDVDQVLEIIQDQGITYFPGPPTIFHSLLEHPRLHEYDVNSLRFSLTGSADVPVDLIQRMLDELTFDRVVQAYGMTECGTATNTIASDSPETIATTIGKASKDLEVRIVDDQNNPLDPGEKGEIVVRGYAVMDGYLNDDEATSAAIDQEGWLHTGDLGTCDENGYFQILGRIKDMIIVGGFNVYPAEVEDIMRENPSIRDVALIGVPDERLGEVGCAFVILRESISSDDIHLWCRENMANFKVPRYIEFLEEFPLTGSNKISKLDLRDLAEQKQIGR